MKRTFLVAAAIAFVAAPAVAAEGLVNVQSEFDVEETANRMESILEEKGLTLFNRIKHSEAAAGVGIELRDTELIIFGNPKVGSPLMQCQQSVAIDLPQKALIWEDEEGQVWISYNEPAYLEARHDIEGCEEVIENIGNALNGIAESASKN
ncbi:MAG: DUF302 domain-containing protein [Cyanobacteria bacterium P01_D01_bin.123]